MEKARIAHEVFNTLCSRTQPDRDTVAAHQIPLVTFFCVSVYGGPARGIGTDLERFRIKIPDYFCLSTYHGFLTGDYGRAARGGQGGVAWLWELPSPSPPGARRTQPTHG